jgi:hypothetical protein
MGWAIAESGHDRIVPASNLGAEDQALKYPVLIFAQTTVRFPVT